MTAERRLIIPEHYENRLDVIETQSAIKFVKDRFQTSLAEALGLRRVSAPMFVRPETGLNDDLNGTERAVSFDVPDAGFEVQVVHSLAKWKRYTLGVYGFARGEGLYTDMNAIRRDETLDNLHSIYVDQWDWEKIIRPEERSMAYLEETVRKIVSALCATQRAVKYRYPRIESFISEEVSFVSSEELLRRWPDKSPREREDLICEERGTVFVSGIGGALSDGSVHDGRAPDYDDWTLNGDILIWYPLLKRAVELSSMGIRVDEAAMRRQLAASGCEHRSGLMFHKMLLSGELPQTIGGGIGQSRMCMVMLQKAHIGEVQAAVWPEDEAEECRQNGIFLL
ncbi:MAG: aspartate--ammonia ligase [Oscillospiraceae bacterium]|nr:aspartate--ammonia ligase [Oscillospiraceae bacterium]